MKKTILMPITLTLSKVVITFKSYVEYFSWR